MAPSEPLLAGLNLYWQMLIKKNLSDPTYTLTKNVPSLNLKFIENWHKNEVKKCIKVSLMCKKMQ